MLYTTADTSKNNKIKPKNQYRNDLLTQFLNKVYQFQKYKNKIIDIFKIKSCYEHHKFTSN